MGKDYFRSGVILSCVLAILAVSFFRQNVYAQEETVAFEISAFEIIGNTIFSGDELKAVIKDRTGEGKTADDVEAARDQLEKYYQGEGYPTVIVNIPEQTVEDGVVFLEVIESRIRRVRMSGNRYFTREKILQDLPSIVPGRVLYVTDVQKELAVINQNPDLKVAPVLIPGKEVGVIDVELKVKDKLPLHGGLEINNRGTHATTDYRVNGSLNYDNLWQKEHSVSLQFQTSPEDTSEVQAITASYVMPALWNDEQLFVMYALWSDSEIAFGEGFQTVGKGLVAGVRNIIVLPTMEGYAHSMSLGLDYNDMKENYGYEDEDELTEFTMRYYPISIAYNAVKAGDIGYTRMNMGVKFVLRNLAADTDQFENKRYKSSGNFFSFDAGLGRNQNLPLGLNMDVSADGQLASQPLISSEQYIAGGMDSVRGYLESEAAGDNAVHTSVELRRQFQIWDESRWSMDITPYLFYDGAWLRVKKPLAGQTQYPRLQGTGIGMRGTLFGNVEFQVDYAAALSHTEEVQVGDREFYFKVKGTF
jgi:hemolysin activation/secretion protein